MSSYTGLSPKGPNNYVGPNVYLSTVVTRTRRPTGADYRQPETGKLYPTGSYWLVGANPTTGVQGELWYLSKIVANVAYWLMLSAGGAGPVLSVDVDAATAPGVIPVEPDVNGLLTISGAAVANHSVPLETHTRALNEFNVEVQYAASAAATDGTKAGVAVFNSAQFSVDASGFVSLTGGGAAIDSLGVQATSGGGTDPVVPDGTGKIEMEGALVAAGTNPLRAVSTAANTVQYQVQTTQALASADSTKVGLANFNSTQFSVDGSGFVSLTTSGPAFSEINLQTFSASGTYTPTTGMVYCVVEIVGGGGGGGGVASNGGGGTYSAAGGGGAGEYGYGIFTAADIGASQTITIGAGGAGGAAGNNSGATGGTTSFGTLMTAVGGGGGSGSPAVALIAVQIGGIGGIGGTVATHGYNAQGQLGICGFSANASNLLVGGGGASTVFGGGGNYIGNSGAGQNATGYGAGGGGAASVALAGAYAGGNGTGGFVKIVEYI